MEKFDFAALNNLTAEQVAHFEESQADSFAAIEEYANLDRTAFVVGFDNGFFIRYDEKGNGSATGLRYADKFSAEQVDKMAEYGVGPATCINGAGERAYMMPMTKAIELATKIHEDGHRAAIAIAKDINAKQAA